MERKSGSQAPGIKTRSFIDLWNAPFQRISTTTLFTGFILGLAVSMAGCSVDNQEAKCRILVAASARDAAQRVVDAFEASANETRNSRILLISGPSNGLAQQILAGAPADIFISAAPKWTSAIENQCDVVDEYVGNRLVLATHRLNNEFSIKSLRDLEDPKVSSIAVAAESVPLGEYARQVLGMSNELHMALGPKLVFAKDSSALVAWLETREADFGFVYASDLRRSADLKEVLSIDQASHDPITYSIAKLKNDLPAGSKLRDQVYDWLRCEASMQIFEDAGFVPMNKKPPAVSNTIE